MKIVTVGYLQGCGGAERQIVLLSNQLVKLGHDVTLCILAYNRSPYIISPNVNVIDLSKNEGEGILRIIKRYNAFRKTIKSYNPDVIINYNLQSAFFCLGIAKRHRGIVIYSERGDPYDKEYSGLRGIIRDYTVNHIDALVFQSEGARDYFSEDLRKKSIVIHNSVNIPQKGYQIPTIREKRIVTVGRLHRQKNQRMLIDSFFLISNSFPDYTLEIYGEGSLYSDLKSHIDSLNLSERVFLLGNRKDIFDCIYKASLFVLTSDFEGMPNCLMEAMALGLPCISTDCRPGGARTLIETGINGIIVPCGDINKLAEAIKEVLSNHEFANRIAIEAKKITETHSNDMVFRAWNDFLYSIINK